MPAQRRTLSFATLDDAVRDAAYLVAIGYEKTGNWDLAQVCGHLSEWLRFPMDGFPRPPALVRLLMWGVRNTVGPKVLRGTLANGTMRDNAPRCHRPCSPQTARTGRAW